METPKKRPAFEPGHWSSPGAGFQSWDAPRPITTTVGVALVLTRALLTASVLFGWVFGWDGILSSAHLITDTVGTLTDASNEMITLVVVVLVADVVMAALIFLREELAPRPLFIRHGGRSCCLRRVDLHRKPPRQWHSFQALSLDILILAGALQSPCVRICTATGETREKLRPRGL